MGMLIGLTASGELYSVDTSTGATSLIGASGLTAANYWSLAYDSTNDVLYGTCNVSSTAWSLCTVNRTTGTWTEIGPTGSPTSIQITGLGHDPTTDTLYGVSQAGGQGTGTLDRTTGAFTSIGATGLVAVASLTYDDATSTMYGTDYFNAGPFGTPVSQGLYTVNLSTGAWTAVGPTGATNNWGLAYDPYADQLWGSSVTAPGSLYSVNSATGAWTLVGATGTPLYALEVVPA